MDARAHEATYGGFIRFVEIGTIVVICHVLALAVLLILRRIRLR